MIWSALELIGKYKNVNDYLRKTISCNEKIKISSLKCYYSTSWSGISVSWSPSDASMKIFSVKFSKSTREKLLVISHRLPKSVKLMFWKKLIKYFSEEILMAGNLDVAIKSTFYCSIKVPKTRGKQIIIFILDWLL
jgi:hypothetical protein